MPDNVVTELAWIVLDRVLAATGSLEARARLFSMIALTSRSIELVSNESCDSMLSWRLVSEELSLIVVMVDAGSEWNNAGILVIELIESS